MTSWKNWFVAAGLFALAIGLLWVEADSRTRGLLLTTLKLCLAVVAVSVPCGVVLAVLTARTDVFGRRIAGGILTTMLFVPLYLQAAGWYALFGPQATLTLAGDSYSWLLPSKLLAAIWIHSLAAVPWVAPFVRVALRHVDPELEESALLDLSPIAVVCRVTLPMISPAIMAAALWVAIIAAGEITVTDLFQVRTFAEEIYNPSGIVGETIDKESSLPAGTGVLCAVLVAGLAAAAQLIRQPIASPVRTVHIFLLRAWRLPATMLLAVMLLAVAGVPLANLLYNAGVRVEQVAGTFVRSWSAAKAISMVGIVPSRFSSELGWSAVIGMTSATLCLALAIPLAWSARRGGWRSWPAVFCVAIGSALPGTILGLWIIRLLNRPELDWLSWLYDHTILAPVLATTVRAIPATVMVMWYGLQSVSQDLLDAAAVDRLAPMARLWRVVAPIRARVFLAAWLLAFVIVTGDLSASILVTPPGLFTIPVRIFGLLHAGVDDQVAGLCLTNVGLVLLVQVAFAGVVERSQR